MFGRNKKKDLNDIIVEEPYYGCLFLEQEKHIDESYLY